MRLVREGVIDPQKLEAARIGSFRGHPLHIYQHDLIPRRETARCGGGAQRSRGSRQPRDTVGDGITAIERAIRFHGCQGGIHGILQGAAWWEYKGKRFSCGDLPGEFACGRAAAGYCGGFPLRATRMPDPVPSGEPKQNPGVQATESLPTDELLDRPQSPGRGSR